MLAIVLGASSATNKRGPDYGLTGGPDAWQVTGVPVGDALNLGPPWPAELPMSRSRRAKSEASEFLLEQFGASRVFDGLNGGGRHGFRKRSAALAAWGSHPHHYSDCVVLASLRACGPCMTELDGVELESDAGSVGTQNFRLFPRLR